MKKQIIALGCLMALLSSCKKNEDSSNKANLQFQFDFDTSQERLNNIGQPANIPAGNAAQTPDFKKMSVHYIELAPNAFTLLGEGAIVYKGAETSKGGENAVNFDLAVVKGANELFAKINVSEVPPGTYEWVRASVTYQNYDVLFDLNGTLVGDIKDIKASIASFVGFNTYITSVTPFERKLDVNANKKQGFWALETRLPNPYAAYNNIFSGEAPAGATTVVNPLFNSSPIPPRSCVVTGKFAQPLVITGKETGDVTVTLSFSVNKSFEWKDDNGNGKLDLYSDPNTPGEKVVDMGLRGMKPKWD